MEKRTRSDCEKKRKVKKKEKYLYSIILKSIPIGQSCFNAHIRFHQTIQMFCAILFGYIFQIVNFIKKKTMKFSISSVIHQDNTLFSFFYRGTSENLKISIVCFNKNLFFFLCQQHFLESNENEIELCDNRRRNGKDGSIPQKFHMKIYSRSAQFFSLSTDLVTFFSC